MITLLAMSQCAVSNKDITAHPGSAYQSLRMKVKIMNKENGKKQSIKVLVKFNETSTRMLFLGPPLNKVYARLFVQGEKAILVNSKKKIYWQGEFMTLLTRMWDMDFDFQEFKQLILNGIVPKGKEQGLHPAIHVQKGGDGLHPSLVEVKGEFLTLEMKIGNRKNLPGLLSTRVSLEGLVEVELDRVLEQE